MFDDTHELIQQHRADSVFRRILRALGWSALCEVMELLGQDDKSDDRRVRVKQAHRWLVSQGFTDSSEAALSDMRRTCRGHWLFLCAYEEVEAVPLPEMADETARRKVKRALLTSQLEAKTAADLIPITEVQARHTKGGHDERKVKALEARVTLAEAEAARKVLVTRMEGAEFLNEILSEAAKLEALRALHGQSVKAGEPVKARLQKIIAAVWGDQVPAEAAAAA
jgi:hypothetical protein